MRSTFVVIGAVLLCIGGCMGGDWRISLASTAIMIANILLLA